MTLYEYLNKDKKDANGTPWDRAVAAKEAYRRYCSELSAERSTSVVPMDSFSFMLVDIGLQAFTYAKDQLVIAGKGCDLGIVVGWRQTLGMWYVRVKTAGGIDGYRAEDLSPADYPEGIVELVRGACGGDGTERLKDKVHAKVDEAFDET